MDRLNEKEKENDANYAKHAKSGALADFEKSLKIGLGTASIMRFYLSSFERIYLSGPKVTAHCLLSSHTLSLSAGTRSGYTKMPSRYVTWQDSRSFAKLPSNSATISSIMQTPLAVLKTSRCYLETIRLVRQ